MNTTPGSGTVRLGSPMQAHLAAAVEQLRRSTPYSVAVVTQDVRWAPGHERIFQDYRGDVSGRFLDAVQVAHAEALPVDRGKAASVLREVLKAQRPDGFFGPPSPPIHVDHGSAWGHGRLLDGLLSARAWAPDELGEAVRRATALLAEGIAARVQPWVRWMGAAEGQKFRLDPLSTVLPMARFAETADSKPAFYAARTLAEALPDDVGGAHMHGYLLALRGRLEVGRLTGADDLVDDVRERVETVAERYVLAHGGVCESLTLPWDVNTEGCGIADWIMLNLRLYSMFSDHRYLDRAAVSAFNALLHTQRASGHFGCETLSGDDGVLVSDYAPEAWWCCTFHGIRALHDLAENAVTIDDDVISVHVPLPLARMDWHGDELIRVDGSYPYDDQVTVTAGPAYRHGQLRLRIPSTATLADLLVDGERVGTAAADGWVRLSGLRPGSRVTVVLDQHEWFAVDGAAVVPPFSNTTTRAPDLSAARCAVFRGPVLLAAPSPDNSVEDLLRGRFLVHPPDRVRFDRDSDGQVSVVAAGHDTFRAALRLGPLVGDDRAGNDAAVRISFHGLLYAERDLHGSASL